MVRRAPTSSAANARMDARQSLSGQGGLMIGGVHDPAEKAADRMADRVMRMPAPVVHRKCVACEGEAKKVQRAPEQPDEEEMIQTKPAAKSAPVAPGAGAAAASSGAASAIRSMGSGKPLARTERAFFEPRFGTDLSSVRVHDGAAAGNATRAVSAHAFTLGNDIAFASGERQPGTETGRHLMAHELSHVVQQSAGGSLMLQREITKDSIKTKDGDFYSTHCGWVDTGHANPRVARSLIPHVREASQRIERRQEALTKTLAAEPPALVSETSCSATYEKGEQAESRTDTPTMSDKLHPSGAIDIMLGGFEVNGFDSTKFGGLLQTIAQTHAAWEMIRGQKFGVEVWGLSDCIGRDERNNKLRLSRAAVVSLALSRAIKGMTVDVKSDHALTDYVASNSTREGRRKNRGVHIRFVPQVTPETFGTPTMESRFAGVQVSAVTPQAQLNRPLSKDEVLSVALTIFATQSTAFEVLQAWRDVIPFAPPSSKFAEEDLPSNLIGFYRAASGFSIDEVRSFCGAWDKQRSVAKLKGYTFVPNRTFRAQRLPLGGAWPTELQTIAPAPFNSDAFKILRLRFETPLVAFNCSIDPKTNSVKCP